MKILVTGGLGLIGHRLVAMLETQGHEIVITDIQTTYGIVPQSELDYLLIERRRHIATDRIYRIDICDRSGIDWLLSTHKPDCVIHLASFPRQKVVNADPAWGSRVMMEGLINLLESSARHDVSRFVYVSSSMVYGNFQDAVSEHAVCMPQGQYGIMKLAGEWLTRDYTRTKNLAHTIIRPSAVYGPLDVEDRVISRFMLRAMRDETLTVRGASETLDFTYVDDAARGIMGAALSLNAVNKTYNITKSHSVTLLQAAQKIVELIGRGRIEIHDKDADFPSRGALNIEAAQRDFGYDPQVDVEQGFQIYHEWLANSVYWNQKTV